VAVRVADVRAYLRHVHFGFGEEVRTLSRPLLVDLVDVGDPDIDKRARSVELRRRFEGDLRLVVGWTASGVQNQPRVRDLHDHWVALVYHLTVEERLVELTRAILIGHDKEVRQDEAFLGRGEVWIHVPPPVYELVSVRIALITI